MTMPKGWTPEKIRKDARNYSLAAEARKLVQQQAAAQAKEEERRREAGISYNRNTTLPNSYGYYYCLCGHTQTEHNREFKINRGTMPKGMNAVESKTDFSHNACSVCECTNYIEREIAKRMGESWENFVKPQPQQQRPPQQQQKIRRSDGSWFYYSSNTYVMPVEDTTGSSDDTSNNSNDTTTQVDTVEGDYEF